MGFGKLAKSMFGFVEVDTESETTATVETKAKKAKKAKDEPKAQSKPEGLSNADVSRAYSVLKPEVLSPLVESGTLKAELVSVLKVVAKYGDKSKLAAIMGFSTAASSSTDYRRVFIHPDLDETHFDSKAEALKAIEGTDADPDEIRVAYMKGNQILVDAADIAAAKAALKSAKPAAPKYAKAFRHPELEEILPDKAEIALLAEENDLDPDEVEVVYLKNGEIIDDPDEIQQAKAAIKAAAAK